MDETQLRDFGNRYTAAWCSQNPASVATFFAETGSLQINQGAPSVGRAAIASAAQGFMTAFPDVVVKMDSVSMEGTQRAVLERIGPGHVLAIDRSRRAIAQARAGSKAELATGRLEFRQIAAEDLVLGTGEAPYDLAFAIRTGALDGRHPEAGRRAIESIRKALVRGGHLYIDGGNPLRKVALIVD